MGRIVTSHVVSYLTEAPPAQEKRKGRGESGLLPAALSRREGKEIGGKRESRLYPIAFTATSGRPGTREVQPAEVSGSWCISLLALTRCVAGSIGRPRPAELGGGEESMVLLNLPLEARERPRVAAVTML